MFKSKVLPSEVKAFVGVPLDVLKPVASTFPSISNLSDTGINPIPIFVSLSKILEFPTVPSGKNLTKLFVVPVPVTGFVNAFCRNQYNTI